MDIQALRAERINAAIEASGYSYTELEKLTGFSKSSLQRYATGETKKIPIDCIEKIAEVTNTDKRYLMGWEHSSIYFDDKPADVQPKFSSEQFQKALKSLKNALSSLGDKIYEMYADDDSFVLYYYNELNHEGKKEALKRVTELYNIPKYKKSNDNLSPEILNSENVDNT